MTSRRTYDYSLRISDPIDFESDAERHALRMLRDKFDGICYKNARIVRVVSVLKCSDCVIQYGDLDCEGVTEVQFEADVETFPQWEVLVGVKIVQTTPVILGCFGESAVVQFIKIFQHPAVINTLTTGFTIPARVVVANYQVGTPMASVVAVPLTCESRSPAWRAGADLTAAHAAHLMPFVSAIRDELRRRAEQDSRKSSRCRFLDMIIYAFRTKTEAASKQTTVASDGLPDWVGPPSVKPPAGVIHFNVINYIISASQGKPSPSLAGNVVSRDLSIHRSSPLASFVESGGAPADWQPPVDAPAIKMIAQMLTNVVSSIRTVLAMTDLYGTQEMLARHTAFWAALRQCQREPGGR